MPAKATAKGLNKISGYIGSVTTDDSIIYKSGIFVLFIVHPGGFRT